MRCFCHIVAQVEAEAFAGVTSQQRSHDLRPIVIAVCCLLFSAPAAADVLVGVAAPLTGRFAEQGRLILKSVEEAVVQANKTGGLLGDQLKVVSTDDACEAKAGAEAARKLVEGKVAVVIGHNCGSAALAAAPIYAKADTLLFSLTRHPDLTDKRAGPTIYRMAGRDDRQGEAIAKYILSVLKGSRVALVHDRTTFGRALTTSVQILISQGGLAPVIVESLVAGEKDYIGIVEKVRRAQADAIVFGGFPAEAAILIRQLRAAGVVAPFIGGQPLAAQDFAAVAEVNSDGILVPGDVRLCCGNSLRETPASLAVTALQTWSSAVKSTQTMEAKALSGALGPRSDSTGTGNPAQFDARGNAQQPSFDMWVWRGGKLNSAAPPH